MPKCRQKLAHSGYPQVCTRIRREALHIRHRGVAVAIKQP